MSTADIMRLTDRLFCLSESRGRESSGLAVFGPKNISVFKDKIPASNLIRQEEYRRYVNIALRNGDSGNETACLPHSIAIIGHSRLVTNGSQEQHGNNQPVIKDGVVGVHNGIVVNDAALWDKYPELRRTQQVDTEVIMALIRMNMEHAGSIENALQETYSHLAGSASIAALFCDMEIMALATNTGSMYRCRSIDGNVTVVASESWILLQLCKERRWRAIFRPGDILQLKAGEACVIRLVDGEHLLFPLLAGGPCAAAIPRSAKREIVDESPRKGADDFSAPGPVRILENEFKGLAPDVDSIRALRRCTRCILPETMPSIDFDESGVCNYCRGYQPYRPRGREALEEFAARYRSANGETDCIVPFSGGRDSSYSLHYVKKELKMHPVAFSYDWGMVTDLARRNQARVCGKLGVEHILISADISRKRRYIRQNIIAWLKRPRLGVIPLFMAGDKQYFWHANNLRKRMKAGIILYGGHPLEETFFKEGFCGVPPRFDLVAPLIDKVNVALFYARETLLNPDYLNSSILDTWGGYISYYLIPHNYLRLYRYIRWDEDVVNSTLKKEYDWEVAADTPTTWRIGDGTASFYNYIYYVVAGFTENDTFRSNQVREGILTREKALEIAFRDNQPRFESIRWYCDTIDLDMASTLARIQAIPKLYRQESK